MSPMTTMDAPGDLLAVGEAALETTAGGYTLTNSWRYLLAIA
jgi:hypothetical protein